MDSEKKAYVVAVDMGYGHQRAAYPLRKLAVNNKIINTNSYRGIPKSDKKIWQTSRESYEFISRFKKVPILGEAAFDIFNLLQSIPDFYPKENHSAPTLQLKYIYHQIKSKKWGKHLIEELSKRPRPLITTFFIPALMADYYNYPGEIYCLATDTDISRAWVPMNPRKSKIKYFSPSYRVAQRLKLYGVDEKNIFVTGFPLPDENVGKNEIIVKQDLGKRLFNLDPKKIYTSNYRETICQHLGAKNFPKKKCHPLTLMFAVGGAGAQRELGIRIVKSLRKELKNNTLNIILVAGIHNDVSRYFRNGINKLGLRKNLDKNIKIIYSQNKHNYFKKFNRALRHTDILWTKPSELSFYTALGLPIIMSEPLGSQEVFNQHWLRTLGSGINQENPDYTNQWLFDWLDSGWFAEAAMDGFLKASTQGLENIDKVIHHKPEKTVSITKVLPY
ncbi:hypothetical protein KKC32_04410 [Patescibacteria group bacterium]|nr:hypothetical protein [Patescibacteria group bacterium]